MLASTSEAVFAANQGQPYAPGMISLMQPTLFYCAAALASLVRQPSSFGHCLVLISSNNYTCRRAPIETFVDAALQASKKGKIVVSLDGIEHLSSDIHAVGS